MAAGAKMDQSDNNGFYAIHLAAKNAARATLETLVKHGEQHGYTREYLLSQCDRENNSPLHSAVNSGDYQVRTSHLPIGVRLRVQSVALCLEHGARVDFRQETRATALHLACSQGSLQIVRLLYEMHKKQHVTDDTPEELLHATDVQGMTPLHMAAMFDHPTVVVYLLDEVIK